MTFFTESNDEARTVAPENAAMGPRVGFLDAFDVAVEAQKRASSQFGIEYYMHELDWQQVNAMRDAGVPNPPQLSEFVYRDDETLDVYRNDEGYFPRFGIDTSGAYLEAARSRAGQEVDEETLQGIAAYNKRIAEIQATRPDLHLYNSEQMVERVRKRAQEVERQEANQRRTWGGTFGAFAGGALASLHPKTDPLNFWTLGVGGAGKTAMQRILYQTGFQGGVEAVNQVTGVQEERDLLGLSTGFADAALRVGATAVGAGALQGVGEGLSAGFRRWFRNAPEDPAPPAPDAPEPLRLPPPARLLEEAQAARVEADPVAYVDYLADVSPLSGLRAGRPRAIMDINDITRQLDSWEGGNPAFIRPRTADAAYPGKVGGTRVDVAAAVRNNEVHQAARAVDPQAFDRFDKLTSRKETFKRWLDELAEGRSQDISDTVDAIDRRIHSLEARLRTTQGKNNKSKLRKQIREAQEDRQKVVELSARAETKDVADVRRELVRTDEQMRDLAPLIGRAYARARDQWGNTPDELNAVWDAYRNGRTQVNMPESSTTYDEAVALHQRVPELQRATPAETRDTVVETVSAVLEAEAKVLDDALEAYRQTMRQVLSETSDGRIGVGSHEFALTDKVYMPQEDGNGGREVTVKELLEYNRQADDELEAITTCSIKRPS